jgi:hypothetical protein
MRLTLENEHRRILAFCGRMETLLRSSDEPSPLFLTPVRDEFATMLIQHMHFKDAMIYGPLRRATLPSRRSTVMQMDALCAALYKDYGTHRDEWPAKRIEAEWDAYRQATLELLERLDRAIQLERVHIYPLLASIDAERVDPISSHQAA